ncbi:MAG: glycosyltransferase family 39 protein [bacterium]|nr:glycosyltransferase family 39 protein [bacterium]
MVLIVAALFRLPFLASHPIGVHADEASIGYDAYSLWETGRDQHGVYLPLFARSFGDYDEALHRYLVVPSVAVFGLNAFAIRLPNALLGILTVWVVYHLVQALWGRPSMACLAGLFLAISPWHVHFSRWSVRAILLPLLFSLGLLLFLKGKDRALYWVLSALVFGICLHTYSSARVFVPLFLVGLAWIYRRELMRRKGISFASACVFLGILVGLLSFWISPEGMRRTWEMVNLDPIALIYSYAAYFSPDFLFFSGDSNLRHSLLGMGQLYHCELVLVPIGLWRLWHEKREESRVLWLWLALYPIPAALTGEPHAIRSIVAAPLFAILSGCGIYTLWTRLQSKRQRRIFTTGAVLIGVTSGLVYLKLYYVDYPKYSGWWWEYGLKEVIAYAEQRPYACILHNQGFYTSFYIHVLFHTRFPPKAYQKLPQVLRENRWEYVNRPLNDKYLSLDASLLSFEEGVVALIAIRPEDIDILDQTEYVWREVHRIYDPGGKELIRLVEAKKGESKK